MRTLYWTPWLTATMLLLLGSVIILIPTPTYAQSGDSTLNVVACYDLNADGDCNDGIDGPAPPAVEVCLNDTSNCQPVPASFGSLSPGIVTPFLRFPGSSEGHYPTTPRTPLDLAAGETVEVALGLVYPIHPKSIAVHRQLNKVYVAFQGPTIGGIRPHPFVAVIDGETDEVLRTIPGGENGVAPDTPTGLGVGRDAWGIGIPSNGEFVYVGSFADGIITVIDPVTDVALTNITPSAPFTPIATDVNPLTGRVHFTDIAGGRVLVLNDNPATFLADPIPTIIPSSNFPTAFSSFEIAIADTPFGGYNFVTLRDAFAPNPYSFVGHKSDDPFNFNYHDITLPNGQTGNPHAIGLWQEAGRSEARLFVTYAEDPRPGGPAFPNPNRLLLYGFSPGDPDQVTLRTSQIQVGDYAEVGLFRNPDTNHMLGTYAGFAYLEDLGHVGACDNSARGGTYALTFNGDRLGVADGAATPEVWKYPKIVIGNPPFHSDDMRWRNPFEMARNPNNGKVYVTDRCWNEFPEGGIPGGGAVVILDDTSTPDVPSDTNPALTVTKSDHRDPVIAGMELIYTIRVENTGDVNLNATIVDTLPPEVTTTEPTVWDNVFIPFGSFWEQTLTVTVTPGTSGLFTNRVDVTTTEGASGQATEETVSVISAIQVRKSDSIDPVVAGDILTYTIEVQNVGELDLHTTITDTLPPEVTPLGPTTWELLIPADQLVVLTLPVRVAADARGPLLNHVDVTTLEGPANAVEETTLVANLQITKAASTDPVNAGDPLLYTIRVENVGSTDLHANIVDTLPSDAIPLSLTSWDNVLIPVGGVWEEVLNVLVDPNAFMPLTNRVAVTTIEGATGEAEITIGVVSRGIIFIKACLDQDADGSCLDPNSLPDGVLGCLRDSTGADLGCQAIGPDGAIFTNLASTHTYTPYLQFSGDSQGFYPTTRPQELAVSSGVFVEALLGAIYPVHPKGVGIHAGQNKAYVAVQGPKVGDDHPFPFVAVIDAASNAVLYTIPGGTDGIGRGPWGVAVSGDFVYVGSFADGRVSVIDPSTDLVIANRSPSGTFSPTAPAVNPVNGQVHFPDYRGGRTVTLADSTIVDGAFIHARERGLSPFEMVIAGFGPKGQSFVTLRDALQPHAYKFAILNNASRELNHIPLTLPNGSSGNPHAIGIWQQPGEARLFISYADDPRPTNEAFPNPNKLAVYSVSAVDPKNGVQQRADVSLGDYAEVGLVYNAATNQMLGTFAGFPYSDANGDEAACASSEHGGTYFVELGGNVSGGPAPAVAVGNPPLASSSFNWKNPFEIAISPNDNKIFITDRCWNEYPGLSSVENRGAVLIIEQGAISTMASPATAGLVSRADVNGDGIVDIYDVSYVAGRYGTTDPLADLNNDGTVDIVDVSIVAANYDK